VRGATQAIQRNLVGHIKRELAVHPGEDHEPDEVVRDRSPAGTV
jgi:hypothetical protein